MNRKGMRIGAVIAVVVLLLMISIPLQYLARTEVVAGLAPGSAHAHAHGEGEEAHEHEHEHPDEEGHLAAEVPLGVNLIPNYGFEVGTRERIPGWLRITDEQGGLLYRDDSTSYRGLASAAVVNNERMAEGAGWITKLDYLPLDHDVVVEAYVRTELVQGGAYLSVVYEHPGEGDEVLATFAFSQGVEGGSEWTFQDVRCYIPPEALSVYVQVTLYGQGSAWFDEVTLRVEEKGGAEI